MLTRMLKVQAQLWIPLAVVVGRGVVGCTEDPETGCSGCPGETSGGKAGSGGKNTGGHIDTGGTRPGTGGRGGDAGDVGFGGSEPVAGQGGIGGGTGGTGEETGGIGGDGGESGAGHGGTGTGGTPSGSCTLTELGFELFSEDFAWFGKRLVSAGSPPRAEYGELHPGNYKVTVGANSQTECTGGAPWTEANAVPFEVTAGETTELRLMAPCKNEGCVEVVFAVGGSAEECPALTVTPESAQVGDTLTVTLPDLTSGETTVSLDPYAIVADFGTSSSPSELEVKCRAAGTAKLSFDATEGPCGGFRQRADIVCTAPPNSECCPIGTIEELQSGACTALGGSPPCYAGCKCLRDGGSISTISDANGCLEWSLKRGRTGPNLVCLDENDALKPDPRKVCGTLESPVVGLPSPDCSASAIGSALDPLDTVCASTAARTCDPKGTWRVSFPKFDSAMSGLRCVENAPPEAELLLTYPGDFKVSANGCDLTYEHTEAWRNESECGAFGYTLYLQINGDQASGSLHSMETGFCSVEGRDFATALRLP